MKIRVYTINAFAKTSQGGNPAGIVFDADFLSEEEMKHIAAAVGFSETAFVSHSAIADFKVRFFTPNEEVDLCGHATIGTFFTMFTLGRIKPGSYTQETKAGLLEINIEGDGFVMMEQSAPVFSEIVPKDDIAQSLGIDPDQFCADLPIQVVSTGLRDVLVPVQNKVILNSLHPNMEKVEQISRRFETVGYHVFCLEPTASNTVFCRNFAPLYGIPEEAATGTSNGALACYLHQYGKLGKAQEVNLIFNQGDAMERPSEIRASLRIRENEISAVRVGGRAMGLNFIEIEFK
jgi:PhzF family phenazine biosynthesis protein